MTNDETKKAAGTLIVVAAIGAAVPLGAADCRAEAQAGACQTMQPIPADFHLRFSTEGVREPVIAAVTSSSSELPPGQQLFALQQNWPAAGGGSFVLGTPLPLYVGSRS